MYKALAQRIRKAYPDGTNASLDLAAVTDCRRDRRIQQALASVASRCSLACETERWGTPCDTTTINKSAQPDHRTWIHAMDAEAKCAWFREHREPYTVLFLRTSRIAYYYHLYYNKWIYEPACDSWHVDYLEEPDSEWRQAQAALETTLKQIRFLPLTLALANEETALVQQRDYDGIPDDDPRWDDDEFEPPWVNCTLHDCLFTYC